MSCVRLVHFFGYFIRIPEDATIAFSINPKPRTEINNTDCRSFVEVTFHTPGIKLAIELLVARVVVGNPINNWNEKLYKVLCEDGIGNVEMEKLNTFLYESYCQRSRIMNHLFEAKLKEVMKRE